MGAKQQEKLKAKLVSVTGKKVQLRMHRDERLIGGVVVKIGDKRMDGSVQGRLAALSKELMANN
jgi:F-type H+-transporting ATPase subunit delta